MSFRTIWDHLGRQVGCIISVLTIISKRSILDIIKDALDVACAFDSCIFSQVLFEAYNRGVNFCIVKCLLYMYHHLMAKLKGDLPFLIF